MFEYIRSLDWKTLGVSIVLCYLLPTLVFGTLFIGTEGSISYFQASLHVLFLVALSPLLGAVFLSLFVRNRPQLHVFVATTIWLILMLVRSESLATDVGLTLAVYLIAFSGCYLGIRLRPILITNSL